MAEVAERSTVDILRAARERISDPERWTTKEFARDAKGYICPVRHADAACWCIEGSLCVEHDVEGNEIELEGRDTYRHLSEAAELLDRGANPASVNDSLGHEATLEMCDRAIQLAEQEAK